MAEGYLVRGRARALIYWKKSPAVIFSQDPRATFYPRLADRSATAVLPPTDSSAEYTGMVTKVVIDKCRNEVVAVVVSRLPAQGQRLADVTAGLLEHVRV
jgi:hypothetical protein